MAAAVKALNAKIRANPTLDYFCSTRIIVREASPSATSDVDSVAASHGSYAELDEDISTYLCDQAHRQQRLYRLQESRLTITLSPDFWGPASNFGIPIAAVADTQKDPDIISGRFTCALLGYSAVFMRYAFAVTPKNYLLFGCHAVNFTAQSVQGYRFTNYWYMGGREKTLEQGGVDLKRAGEKVEMKAEGVVNEVKGQVEKGVEKAKGVVGK